MKPIRFMEFGCPAVDLGTNAPDTFYGVRRDASRPQPFQSTGAISPETQRAYYKAALEWWGEAENNPAGMVEKMYAYGWDVRPYPYFPQLEAVWADGEDYERGHWLNGEGGRVGLGAVLADICASAGVSSDVSDITQELRGYHIGRIDTPRAALEELMTIHGIDCYERGGEIVFVRRDKAPVEEIAQGDLVLENTAPKVSLTRTQDSELPKRTDLTAPDPDNDYLPATASAVAEGEFGESVAQIQTTVVLAPSKAAATVERMLFAARAARTKAEFEADTAITPGDTFGLTLGDRRYILRATRVVTPAHGLTRQVNAVSHAPEVYTDTPLEVGVRGRLPPMVKAAGAVEVVWLDLPIFDEADAPRAHALRVAATATPWPSGGIIVTQDRGGMVATPVAAVPLPSRIGTLNRPLPPPAALWRLDWSVRLSLRITGTLESVEADDLYAGANSLAVQAPSGAWEVVQYLNATSQGGGVWELAGLLRGQVGTEAAAQETKPSAARVVVLDRAAQPYIEMPVEARATAYTYRYGPRGVEETDARWREAVPLLPVSGLRPYAPVHVRDVREANGDVTITWIRRTRIGGDYWDAGEVPLGEATEAYQVAILDAQGAEVGVLETMQPTATYTAAQQTAHGITWPAPFRVYQVSALAGRGEVASDEIITL